MPITVAASRSNSNVNFSRNHSSKPRWQAGRSGARRGFTIVPNTIIDDDGLTHSERALLVLIKSFTRDGRVQVGIPRLARELKWTEDWTRKLRNALVRKGYLTVVEVFDRNGCNLANEYIVHDSPQQLQSNQQSDTPPGYSVVHPLYSKTQKAEDIKHPAGARVEHSPSKPRTRHVIVSGQLATEFHAARGIPREWHRERMRLTQRIEDRLNAGEAEAAIMADLDREYRARFEYHRSPWRSRRREMEERMARDNYTCSYHPPETPAEVEAEDRRLAALARENLIGLATCNARVREEMLRCGQCTQEDIDEGFRLAKGEIK